MKRFRLNIGLLLTGIIFFTAIATYLFVFGWWPQGCLVLIAIIACTTALIQLQSGLIGMMSAFVKALEMNDTTMRVEADGDSELRTMSESMNRISELYRENMRELQTRKLYYDRVLKVMTHEMRNGITPIAAISADMQTHQDRYQGKSLAEATGLLHSQAEGMKRFLDSYYSLTHLPEPEIEEITAGDYFRNLKKIFKSELDRRRLPEDMVSYTVPEEMNLKIDTSLMNQAMLNLFRNALDALPPDGGLVDVVLSVSDSRPYLTVTDNGCGIPHNMMDNLFTPFFTTKPQGSGVGLAICRQIIIMHGGDIRVQSQESKGCRVIISL